jgi:hypothetical protein
MESDAHEYLSKVDLSRWYRTLFSGYPKCDLFVNNICECFNSYILKACDKSILTMLEMIRKKLMRRYQVKRDGIQKLFGKLCHQIAKKLEAIGIEALEYVALYASDDMLVVTAPDGR